jgi:hypothetical protein
MVGVRGYLDHTVGDACHVVMPSDRARVTCVIRVQLRRVLELDRFQHQANRHHARGHLPYAMKYNYV